MFSEGYRPYQRQFTISLELRGAMSICLLGQNTGQTKKRPIKLAEIYDCFTEGFEIENLKEAKVFLGEIS